jgi:curved DNA-binding protein CbpA
MRDSYEIICVAKDAGEAEIKKAIRAFGPHIGPNLNGITFN